MMTNMPTIAIMTMITIINDFPEEGDSIKVGFLDELISLSKEWKWRVKTYILDSPSILKHVLGVQNHTGTLLQKHDL